MCHQSPRQQGEALLVQKCYPSQRLRASWWNCQLLLTPLKLRQFEEMLSKFTHTHNGKNGRQSQKVGDKRAVEIKLRFLPRGDGVIYKNSYQRHLQAESQSMGGKLGHSWGEVEVELQ